MLTSSFLNGIRKQGEWSIETALADCIKEYNEDRTHTSTKFIPIQLFKFSSSKDLERAKANQLKRWKVQPYDAPVGTEVFLQAGQYES